MPTYRGSCHCGAVRFEATGDLEGLEICNCSLCSRTAYLHWYLPPDRFRLLTPEASLRTYRFGTMTSKNHFCGACGISPFRRARSDPDKVDVNARCLEGVDAESSPAKPFDGRNWEQAMRDRSA